MKLILFLLRASWPVAVLAGIAGGISGLASVGLVVIINQALQQATAPPLWLAGVFVALCATVLVSRVLAQNLLVRLTQSTISNLRIGLCRRILDSSLKHLEEIGEHRMLACLTGDVTMVSQAMNGVPVVATNAVILVCGSVYLATLSVPLLLAALVVCALGVMSYRLCDRWARHYIRAGRDAQDEVLRHIDNLMTGIKELKIHRARREEFLERVLTTADTWLRENQSKGQTLQNAAITWGRLLFFLAIGLLLFVWPRLQPIDAATMTSYTLTILFLIAPLEQIVGWMPFLGRAVVSVGKIEQLGLQLNEREPEAPVLADLGSWQRIQLSGVTHRYHRPGKSEGFLLGPLDLDVRRGEILFIVGGNGSGKTTLAKLLTGLYVPQEGKIRLDDLPIGGENREAYRQLFSVVFDDAVVFESLWGVQPGDDLDERARGYLRALELDHVVSVADGTFSTTSLSRGQRKRLALLTAYLEDRDIYLFDEWAADQDPVFKHTFYHMLLPELQSKGKTVLAITHDDRYFGCADRIVKLSEGRIERQPARTDAEAAGERLAAPGNWPTRPRL